MIARGRTGETLYFHVRDSSGNIWNGSAFEAYAKANWATYDITLTEQDTSGVYTGTFPAVSAGSYFIVSFQQVGSAPAPGDPAVGSKSGYWQGAGTDFLDAGGLKTHGDTEWATVAAAVIGGAVLTNANNKLACNASGEVVASNVAALSTIQSVTDKVDTAVEQDGGVYRFTQNALEQAPSGGDATLANQTNISNAVAALNDPSANEVRDAILAGIVDGSLDVQTALKRISSLVGGKVIRTATDPLTLEFYANDDTTKVITLTIQTNGSGRVKS